MNNKAQLDNVFTALAHKYRRAIIHHLSLQPASISELAKELKLSLPAIHKHIKILEKASLLQRKKSGRNNFLALDRLGLKKLQVWVFQYNPHWGNSKESLNNYVKVIDERSNKR